MQLEPEQEELLARMVEGGRDVSRADREWILVSYDGGSFLEGPGIGRTDVPDGDVYMLERAGYIHAVRYSPRDSNPTFVITPEGLDYYAKTRGVNPSRDKRESFDGSSTLRPSGRAIPRPTPSGPRPMRCFGEPIRSASLRPSDTRCEKLSSTSPPRL